VSLSEKLGNSQLRLAIPIPDDNGTTCDTTGVSRFLLYRDGVILNLISRQWSYHWKGIGGGDSVYYYDLTAKPGETYTYSVEAVDFAPNNIYPASQQDLYRYTKGNRSDTTSVSISIPEFSSSALINPHTDLTYVGAFKVPGSYIYGGSSMTYCPTRNSIYAVAEPTQCYVGEFSIPSPIVGNLNTLDTASEVQAPADIFPIIYEYAGSPRRLPYTGTITVVGLQYLPANNDHGEKLAYSVCGGYAGLLTDPAHGVTSLELDVDSTIAAWYVSNMGDTVPFTYTGRMMAYSPQSWADTYTGGRRLMLGLGWAISGHGWPSCGPTAYAVNPYNSGWYGDKDTVSGVRVMRYGTTGNMGAWEADWNDLTSYADFEWISNGSKTSFVVLSPQNAGDIWYGGTDGYSGEYCDYNRPYPSGGHAQITTGSDAVLKFYDPDEMGQVALGTKDTASLLPYSVYSIKSYLYTHDSAQAQIRSMAFDSTTNNLYVWEYATPTWEAGVIHVFHLESDSGVIPTYNLTTSYTGSGSVSPEGTTAQDSGSAVNISATPATHWSFSKWQVLSGSVGIADTLDATTTCTLHTAGSVRAVFGIDSFTTTANAGAHAPITGGGVLRPYGSFDTLVMAPATGYGGRLAGRQMVIYPNRDTLIVEVLKDSTVASVAYFIPVIDSSRPNPWWRNDSASVYGAGFTSAGVIRNITVGLNVAQKYWSDGQIDYYTGNWPRGWNRLQITNSDSLRDTISQYIAIPRKVNP
jgi:hypothetical protein